MGRILAWTPSLTGGIVVVRDPCLHGRFSIGSLCVGPSDTIYYVLEPYHRAPNHTPRADPAPTWGPSRAIPQYLWNGGSMRYERGC